MELGGVTLGLREGVVVLITLVVLYIVFVLLRMYRLHNKRPAPLDKTPPSFAPEPPVAADPVPAPAEADEAPATWAQTSSGMADDVLRRGLEQEMAQLRDEVDAIRGELAALREDMHHELAHLRAGQTVSPIYGDAMQMAAAGYDPATIAERCGIARAEAELVVALAKSQER